MIEFKNVSFTYQSGEREAGLRNISLTIQSGETVLLCGESGCGKTTMTRLINGLIPHFYDGNLTGEVLIDGQSAKELQLYDTARIVGSVFQNPRSQFFNLDTTSELAFGCENQGLPEEEIISRVQDTVETLGLEHLMDRSLFALSGGEKQKIACASVSVGNPDVYVLDEPSSNLDAGGIEELKSMIARWKTEGKTVVIAEHRLYFLRELVDTVLYMKDGEIAEVFTAEQLLEMDNKTLADKGLRPLDMNRLSYSGEISARHNETLSLKDFHFSYQKDGRHTLDIDNVLIPKNSIVALIGHNGAGKSTLARCLCGLEKRFKGSLETDGAALKNKERLSRCYMVMQDVNHQLFTESVLDEVLISMAEQNEAKAEEILTELDLLELKELHPMSLSGGQKQRVAIASAIASERSLILFDEPTSGLDLRHMREVSDMLLKLRDMGKTLFVISHDPELILSCCDYVLEMHSGRIVRQYELTDKSAQLLLGSFYGRAQKLLPAQEYIQTKKVNMSNVQTEPI